MRELVSRSQFGSFCLCSKQTSALDEPWISSAAQAATCWLLVASSSLDLHTRQAATLSHESDTLIARKSQWMTLIHSLAPPTKRLASLASFPIISSPGNSWQMRRPSEVFVVIIIAYSAARECSRSVDR